MKYAFERSAIWQATLADRLDNPHREDVAILREAFLVFRKNASALASRISSALPALTNHDISHLDGLWETASLIGGDNYKINPLEGFIFGGAVLLHDIALCFEAYSGGIAEIRATVEWKDAYELERSKCPLLEDDLIKSNTDFSTLRILHAKEAAKLAERSWQDPDTHEASFLIEDSNLRKHFGPLIGKIASSHHWDIETVGSEFKSQINALTRFPRDWRINPLKIACLLRCADAAHIDQDRAPDFLHALIKRQGISFTGIPWRIKSRRDSAFSEGIQPYFWESD